jgi:Zn-finger nucleic acid-binding protein
MTERSGIEIDYCPQCCRVCLDRGELDKIIERSMGEPVQIASAQGTPIPAPQQFESGREHHEKSHDYKYGYRGNQSI